MSDSEKTNLFIKTPNLANFMTRAERIAYVQKLEAEIIETIKVHKTPTATSRAMDGRASRWQVIRVASRAGLWTQLTKERARQERCKNVDYSSSCYNRRSKTYYHESVFQDDIASFLSEKGISFVKEFQIPNHQSRCDFKGDGFLIEAKCMMGNDDLCRAFGQCMIYKHEMPDHRICVVYPDDIEPKHRPVKIMTEYGIAVMPFRHLHKWFP